MSKRGIFQKRCAIAAARMMGATPSFPASSTDSDIPFAMGLQRLFGKIISGCNALSLDEW